MAKGAEAFRSIGEVATLIGVAPHVLRYWETQFPMLRPMKRPDGRRYYRPADLALAAGLVELLRDEGLTIRGARMALAPDRGETVRARGLARLSRLASEAPEVVTALPDDHISMGEDEPQDEPATDLPAPLLPLVTAQAETGPGSTNSLPGVLNENVAQDPNSPADDESFAPGEPAAMTAAASPAAASASDLNAASATRAGTMLQERPPKADPGQAAPSSAQATAFWLGRLTHLARRLQQVDTLAPSPDAVQANALRLVQAMLRLS